MRHNLRRTGEQAWRTGRGTQGSRHGAKVGAHRGAGMGHRLGRTGERAWGTGWGAQGSRHGAKVGEHRGAGMGHRWGGHRGAGMGHSSGHRGAGMGHLGSQHPLRLVHNTFRMLTYARLHISLMSSADREMASGDRHN